tara:strand:+ start:395 stop:970 length:576 start_codon:yes stop_codon:yes gene_type:complete
MSRAYRLPVLAAIAVLTAGAGMFGQGAFMAAKAEAAQILLAQSWERARAGEDAPRPWPWADTWAVARIEAPRIRRSAIVLAEAGGEALAFGPAHLAATPQPGDPGISVIAAHRDTHFAWLAEMEAGDDVLIERADGQIVRFRLTGFEIVRADESGIEPSATRESQIALVTCWPFGAMTPGPLRYVAWGERV